MRRLLRCLLLLLPFGALASPADAPRIIDRPIRFTEERIELTREYLGRHYGLAVERITIVPQAIVVHWTGIRTLRGSWRAFDRVRVRGRRKRLRRAGAVNVSAHFLVDRDGTIYRLMPETWMARHCIGLNYDAIGIENVGGGGAGALTGKQLEANARLVRYLAGKHPIRYLLGHHEWRRFEKAPFFRERDPHYRHHKADPGPGFMRRLRKRLRDLQLEDRYRQGVTPPASPLKNGSEQPAPRADAAPTRQQAAQMYRWPRRASDYAPLSQRVSAPRSHRRVSAAPGSFALWLRHLPLLPAQTPVRAFDGSQILRPDHPALAAVVDLDLGQRDRQQCADTIMRLWGEYLASQGRAKQVRFGWTGRRRFGFDQWARGVRPVRQGRGWRFTSRGRPDASYASFGRYLRFMFSWTGSWQLASEPRVRSVRALQPGDFFVQPGSPGHAVVVLDVARNDAGAVKVLLGQGFMPAQDLHVLRGGPEGGPWFTIDPTADGLATPFWRPFRWDELRRFPGADDRRQRAPRGPAPGLGIK